MWTHDDRHTGLPRPLPQLRRPPGPLRRPVGDPRACAARRGNAIRGCGMKAFRQFLTVASFCTRQQGATRRGALQQEPRVSQLPARRVATALSCVASERSYPPCTGAAPDITKNTQVRRSHPAAISLISMGFPAPCTRPPILKWLPHAFPQPPHTSAIPMHPNSSILASRPLRPARGCGRPAQADPHTHQPPSGNSQKTAKSAIPHLAGHTLQPMPRRSPCASDPHTGYVPTRFHGSPIQPPSSKNPDIGFDETSVSGSANQAPIRSPRTPCADCRRGDACPGGAQTRRDQRPAYADPRTNPTHSNSLRRRGGHGYGVASRCDAAPTSQWGPAFKPARRPAPAAQGVDPRRIWTG